MSAGMYTSAMPILPIARTNTGEIVIEIDAKNPFPPPPYELLGSLTDSVYQERMRTITAHLKRYNWSLFERIYLFLAILISVAAPWPLVFFVEKAMTSGLDFTNNDRTLSGNIIFTENQIDVLYRARIASFGILAGLALLTWTPYFVFLFLGTRKLNGILHKFNTAAQQEGTPAPTGTSQIWSVRNISVFTQKARVAVAIPMAFRGVSNFHPNAYLPAYVAQPGQWQAPIQWQGVPLDEKRE